MNSNLPLKSYTNTYEEKELAFKKANDLYKSGLSFLSEVLGRLHGITSDQRFWEVILGPWLREASVLYIDRTRSLEGLESSRLIELRECYKNFNSIPRNYEEFSNGFYSDSVLSAILFPRVEIAEEEYSYLSNLSKPSISYTKAQEKLFFKKLVKKLYKFLLRLHNNNFIIYTIEGLSTFDKLKIFFLTFGRALPYVEDTTILNKQGIVKTALRKNLLANLNDFNQSTNINFFFFLIKTLPFSYLEDFTELKNSTVNEKAFIPNTVYLDSRFRTKDDFKILLAEWSSKGTKTFVMQHSLNCLIDFDSSFQNDLTFDNFLYWDAIDDKEKKCSSIRLNKFVKNYKSKFRIEAKFNQAERQKSLDQDLYVCRSVPDIQGGSLAMTTSDSQSIKKGRLELSQSDLDFQKKIVVRIRPGDVFGENNIKANFDSSSNLSFSKSDHSIQDLYHNSRIIIFEGLSMGVTECLVLNKPFLILNNNSYIDLRKSRLKRLFDDLNNLNIIKNTTKDLLQLLSDNYVERFYSNEFQKKLSEITNTYFPVKENYLDDLIECFRGKYD